MAVPARDESTAEAHEVLSYTTLNPVVEGGWEGRGEGRGGERGKREGRYNNARAAWKMAMNSI